MKKLFSLFSMLMMLSSNVLPVFTYANTESEELAKEILIEELDNVFDSGDLLQGSVITTSGVGNQEIKTTAMLISGPNFNISIKSLANSDVNNDTYFNDNNIKKFKKYEGENIPNNKIIISTDGSEKPVYAWYNNSEETVYYFSEADIIYFNEDSSTMFRNFEKLNEINFHDFDLSRVTNMESMFYGFGLKKLDLSFMDLRNVTNTNYMFQSNNQLEEVNFEGIIMSGLQQIGSNSMFKSLSSLKYVNLSGADFRSLKNANSMFAYSNNLTGIDLAYSKFYSLTSATNMFDCSKLKKIDLSYAKFPNLTSFDTFGNVEELNLKFADFGSFEEPYGYNSIFGNNVKNIDMEGADFGSVKSMKYWFQSKNNLKSVNFSGTILTSLTDMSYMFRSNESLTGIDFSNTDLSSVTKMEYMFSSAYGIKYVNFSGSNLQNLTSTKQMFNAAKNLTGVNFHGAILTGLINVEEMFISSYDHEELFNVDLGETKLGTTLNSMFKNSRVNTISFSGADFTKVEDAGKLFYYIPTLLKINFTNIKGANNITNMESMFYQDFQLTGIDLSVFDLSKVKNMYGMFQSCYSLKNINFGNWKIKPEGSLYSMFENNYYLKNIDLSNFDTSEVTNMAYMFASNNSNNELDISAFDTSKVTNMNYMFGGDMNLKTIYVSNKFVTTSTETSENMFNNNTSIVGGNGTTYSGDIVDKTYARIDTETTSGYFTSILDKQYNITYMLEGGVFKGEVINTYTTRNGGVLPKANMTGFELIGWFESGAAEPFVFNQSTKGDKTLYAHWKTLEQKAQETTSKNVVYTNTTTVTVGDETTEEILSGSSTLTLVAKEVESHEVTTEEETTKVQDSEIKVTSDKTVEYEGGLEVYLEKTENVGTENVTTGKVEGTIKFSAPVAVKIPISSDVEYVKVQVKHGDEDFGFKGLTLNPVNECNNGEAVNDKYNGEDVLVTGNTNKYATIYTCSASTFVAYTENIKPVIPQPSAGGGRTITTTKQETKTIEQEHNSADIVEPETTQTSNETVKAPAIEEQVKKIEGRSLTRGEVAIMTNILLEVYPQLVEGKQELDDVTNACSNYADEQNFTKDEKKAITRLCKLSIMGIHNDTNEPLEEFLVNNKSTNDEFSKVINRSIETYNEKDLTTIKDALKKLEGDEENVVFGTVYDMFMGIKNIFS